MKYFLWIISIVTLILLFPIPIKITLIYSKEIFTLKIYNKTIIPSKRKKARKKRKEKPKKYTETFGREEISKFKLRDIKDIFEFIINSKLKASIRTKINVEYSIEDAAVNAVVYGLLHQFTGYIAVILNLFFKVNDFDSSINTRYNENFFKFKSSSIIFINIATIIYIITVIFYGYKKGRKHSFYKNVNLKEEF
ncbi:DUF2953 domain-containing protein [Clostridium sp.]|uniref:DUF2953 domain-containing protein n=1 Tax=Clostridium sp. TaxID=1506 RepID=UPI003216FE17